jgi:hypothetical protein
MSSQKERIAKSGAIPETVQMKRFGVRSATWQTGLLTRN